MQSISSELSSGSMHFPLFCLLVVSSLFLCCLQRTRLRKFIPTIKLLFLRLLPSEQILSQTMQRRIRGESSIFFLLELVDVSLVGSVTTLEAIKLK